MKEKEEKKLTLNKTTIANLNNSEMKKVEGGQQTLVNPHCLTENEVDCPNISRNGGTCHCITNQVPCK